MDTCDATQESKALDHEVIDRLAAILAKNHLHLTLPDWLGERRNEILLAPDVVASEPKQRVIVVVGAGATMAAGFPGTAHAIAEIKKKFSAELLERELDRLALEYRSKREEFETVLLAASRFNRDIVLNALHQMFGYRYFPTLTYEILAHLLKHRFVDAIVNFNFDELLDQSIEDEVGKGHYLHILSDGDCPPDLKREMRTGGRLRIPVYVKPHGTVSHKSTMRFTRSDYVLLPSDIHGFLEELLSDKPITLVVIGFNMQSFEFNQIITKCMRDPQSAVFNFDLNIRPNPPLEPQLLRLYDAGGFIPVTTEGGPTLDNQIMTLWKRVQAQFKPEFSPRQITRHELVCRLATRNSAKSLAKSSQLQTEYLHDRAVIELALAIAKAKAFVNTRMLLLGRAGKYFHLWKEEPDCGSVEPKTLYDLCKSLHMDQCSYSREALRIKSDDKMKSAPPPNVMAKDEFRRSALPKLVRAVAGVIHGSRGLEFQQGSLLERALSEMFDQDEVEVVLARAATLREMCADPQPLDTLTALKACTVEELSKPDWDTLLCIAETGEWLLKQDVCEILKQRDGFRLALIVADDTQRKAVSDTFVFARPQIRRLQWWLHNQHMTLFVKEERVQRAIFFERRLRNSRIAPLVVKGDDAQELMKVFFAYWLKSDESAALRASENQGTPSGPINSNDVEAVRRRFFAQDCGNQVD